MKAIRIHATGGADVLRYEDVAQPAPGPDDALVRVYAAGVNFIDTYQRSGLYHVPLPYTLGQEGAGTVVQVGAGVSGVAVGDRVAFVGQPGAYAEYAAVPAHRLVRLPPDTSFDVGAAVMLQGLTAHYLALTTFPLRPGTSCLIHAAAGGVGLLLTQIAKRQGATVLATVGSEKKVQHAREAGADYVIRYDDEDFLAAVRSRTGGRGVDVVYDGVGRATFDKSLECVTTRGTLVMFGNASGAVPPVDILRLQVNSRYLTRPRLAEHIAGGEELAARAGELFGWVSSGALKLSIHRRYPLAEAASAHRDIENRRTSGKLLLLPQ